MLETEYKALMENVAPEAELMLETQQKMEAALTGRPASRKRLRAALLAAVILLGIIGASAIALTGAHLVDWAGNTVEPKPWQIIEEEVSPEFRHIAQIVSELLYQSPEGELWIMDSGSSQWIDIPEQTFSNLAEMTSRLQKDAPDMLLPSFIPEGYRFKEGRITCYLSRYALEAGVPLLSKETVSTGYTLFKFKLPEEALQSIQSYDMRYENAAGDVLYIACGRQALADRNTFHIGEGGTSEPVDFPGMKVGIFIQKPKYGLQNELILRKSGMDPHQHYHWDDLMRLEDLNAPYPYNRSKMFFQAAVYSFEATVLDKEALLTIAEGLQ